MGTRDLIVRRAHSASAFLFALALAGCGGSGGGSNTLRADFSATRAHGDAPLTVVFRDRSSGMVTAWLWDFGDGTTSTEASPAHTYTDPETCSVSLSVVGPLGNAQTTKPALVRVFDPNLTGIWSSARELADLSMSGPAWDNVLAEANTPAGTPSVATQDDNTDVVVLAKALVFARTGDDAYRQDVIQICMAAIDSELGGTALALARNLVGYVLAADLVVLPSSEDALFRAWLERCRTETIENLTLIQTQEKRPNNWGTHAGASRAAVDIYLGDTADLARCALVFRGWLGERNVYADFDYGDLSWQANASRPVGINPRGATRDGHSIDGVLPDDQRRGGTFAWPPAQSNYVWEALQGALAEALILSRAGYPEVWEWSDQALRRAADWLNGPCAFPAVGDDGWEPYVVNFYYVTDFPAPVPSSPGKNVGWTDWTLSEQR